MSRLKISDLLPGVNYVVQVRAIRGTENSKWSEKFNFQATDTDVAPAAPEDVLLVVSGTSFVLSWTPVTLGVDGNPIKIVSYEIEIVGDSSSYTVPVVAQDAPMTYTLTYAENKAIFGTPEPELDMRVRAVSNKNIKGDWSGYYSATNEAPTTPGNFVATAGLNNIELKWDLSPDDDIAAYSVWTGTPSTFTETALNLIYTGDANRFVYATSTYSTQYFHLRAVDSFGQTSAYALASATPVSPFVVDTTPSSVPTGLAATITNNANGLSSYADVSWNTVAETDTAGYQIRYRRSGSSDAYDYKNVAKPASGTTVSTRIEFPVAYVGWEFNVRSVDTSANYSAWSSTVTASGGSAGTPSTVSGLSATAIPGGLRYTWSAVPELNIKNYELQITTNADTTFASPIATFTNGQSLVLTVNGLTASTTYRARVRAVNVAGTAGSYSTVNATSTSSYNGLVTQVSADVITPGQLGLAGAGVIDIGAGASLRLNGGHLRSNTYTYPGQSGSTYVYNSSATAGFYFGNDGLVIKDGAISASTLSIGGSITSGNIVLAGTGTSGTIQTSGYNGTSGFRLSSSGLEIPDGSLQAAKIIVTSAFSNSVTASTTTIDGGKINTGTIVSTANAKNIITGADLSPVQPAWSISTTGAAQFGNVSVLGRINVGSASYDTTSGIQSYNYVAGSVGWKIDGHGDVEFQNGTFRGNIIATTGTFSGTITSTATISGGNFKTGATGTAHIEIGDYGQGGIIRFYNNTPNETYPSAVYASYSGGLTGPSKYSLLIVDSGAQGSLTSQIQFQSASNDGTAKTTSVYRSENHIFQTAAGGSGGTNFSLSGNFFAQDFIKAGSKGSGTMVAGTDKTVSITFDVAFPDNNYVVTSNVNESSIGTAAPKAQVTNKSPSGFDIVFRREVGTAAITMNWIAARTTASGS